VYTFWFALQLLVPPTQKLYSSSLRQWMVFIIGLLVLQLIYGAFMAGLKGATYAPTWPDINGDYFPPNMSNYGGRSFSFFSAIINNPITIHFIHRNLAYLITILVIVWTIKAAKERSVAVFNAIKWMPLVLVLAQVILGIAAVLTSPKKVPQHWGVFEWNAQLHQFVALLLLLSMVMAYYLLKPKENTKLVQGIDPHLI
jgi:cytochrome c oxidase assembly protein subunit 15